MTAQILLITMLVTWCDDFPRSPSGLFCVGPERYSWRMDESATPPLSAVDAMLRAHNVEVVIVPLPAIKPDPPPRVSAARGR